jgi:hypothetical protein|eukprot:Stramenopile-MAST_4_protein_1477
MRVPSYGVDAAGRTFQLPPRAIRPVVAATRYTFSEISLVFTTGCLSVIVCILCTFQFVTHLRHWRKPSLQKCYLRIVLLAPIYSCFSWFAVLSSRNSGVFDLCRSIYETYVLYTFFALMVYAVGGEIAVQRHLLLKSRQTSLIRRSRCVLCPPCTQDGLLSWKLWTVESPETSLKFWKGCLWQFIVVKPTTAIVTSICEHRHVAIYWDPYIKPISLVSVTVAMCGLLNIYVNLCDHPSIRRLHAASKFLVVKAAIFLTVWQEVIFHILVGQGVIHSPYCYIVGKKSTHCLDLTGFATPSAQRGVRTVATLIIFEMFALSFAMLFYFSYADACLGRQGPQKSICFYDILTVLCFGDIFCELEPEVCFPEPRCKMAVENGLVRPPDEPPQNPALLSDIVHQQYHAHAESDK